MLSHDVWKDDKAPGQEYSDDAKPRFSKVKTDQMAAKGDEQRQNREANLVLRIQRASTISAFDHGIIGCHTSRCLHPFCSSSFVSLCCSLSVSALQTNVSFTIRRHSRRQSVASKKFVRGFNPRHCYVEV